MGDGKNENRLEKKYFTLYLSRLHNWDRTTTGSLGVRTTTKEHRGRTHVFRISIHHIYVDRQILPVPMYLY